MAGDEALELLILTEGIVRVYKHDSKGNEVVINYFQPTSLLAEAAVFEGIMFPANALFETSGSVISIPFKAFKEQFLSQPHIALEVIQSLTGKIRMLERTIIRNLASSAVEKVARFLYEHESLYDQLKQHEVAAVLGITPETLSRVMKRFKEQGIVRNEGRKLRVVGQEMLLDYIS